MPQENVKIETLRQGAVLEVANDALQKIMDNIMDENTSPKVKRKLVLEIVFAPDEAREEVDISIAAKPTLAPVRPVTTRAFVDKVGGKTFAVEAFKGQERDQHVLPANVTPISKEATANA